MVLFDIEEFYEHSCKKGFVKSDAIATNEEWTTQTSWGDIQITINHAKPEKDPRAIAQAIQPAVKQSSYIDPATGIKRPCPLCVTDKDVSLGYAKQIDLCGERWALWFSPYAYYPYHCIAMSWKHRPMHIDRSTFEHLVAFVDKFPDFFIGSNADLPIVGGSILAHDHFQGGRHHFPIEDAPTLFEIPLATFPKVNCSYIKWPLSTLRLLSNSSLDLIEAACHILDIWKQYGDPSLSIISSSGTIAHNTITPILRKRDGLYEMDLALRCNITSSDYPLGVFHPHKEYHHIKKENIGLIEVMGRAILPPRVIGVAKERNLSHDDIGILFSHVLENAGVFKHDKSGMDGLKRFLDHL